LALFFINRAEQRIEEGARRAAFIQEIGVLLGLFQEIL